MFIEEIHTEDVDKWIEDDAQTAYDLFLERGSNVDDAYRCAVDAIDAPAYLYNALAIIAWSGCTFEVVNGECSCFDDSPAAMYERAVYERLVEIIEDSDEE